MKHDIGVLYVEDEPVTRKLVGSLLQTMVSRVYVAGNGEDGYSLFQVHTPDIIVTDIRLPGISGLEMVRRIKAADTSILVIVTTAYNETGYVIEAVDIGINQFVTKPVERKTLQVALERCIDLLNMKETVRRQEEHIRKLSHALEYSPSMSLISDHTGTIEYVNRKFTEVTGYLASEVTGKNVRFFKSDVHTSEFYGEIKQAITSGREWRGEICNRKKNGELFWGWVSISSLNDREGLLSRFIVVMEDITERKKVEAALQESERKYKELADSLPQTVFEADTRGVLTFVNRAASQLFGCSYSAIDRGLPVFDLLAPEERQQARLDLEELFKKKGVLNQEYTAIRQNGTTFPIMVYAGLIYRDSQVLGLRGLVVDMTEQKAVRERIRYLSFHDALTGLYNRGYFEEEMNRLEDGRYDPVGLILCDVNFLKMANDTLGHQVGDRLLRDVGLILMRSFRKNDMVARVGGDEFAILLPRASLVIIEKSCQRIQSLLAEYNDTRPVFPLSLSIGYAVKDSPEVVMKDLFRQADNRMYRHKNLERRNALSLVAGYVLRTFDARDYNDEHRTARMQEMIIQMGTKLDLSPEALDRLRLLAQYHDIGRGGIAEGVLVKRSRLTPEEREEIQLHTQIGYRIALTLPELLPVAELILKHHEWWDGQGYPLGLKESEIPIESRILAIVDAYDAITSERPYRPARTPEEACRELELGAGSQFDPLLVQVFLEAVCIENSDKRQVNREEEHQS